MSLSLQELLEVGAYYGHKKELSHPSADRFIFTNKDEINVINLEDTSRCADDAIKFMKSIIKEGKKVIWVGTKTQAKEAIKNAAEDTKMPYITSRWLGGTMTNFDTIKRRIKSYKEKEELTKSEEFKKFTKKEQVDIKKDLAKLDKFFLGLKDYTDLPGAIFVVDPIEEHVAVAEARKKKIPVIAIANTNVNFNLIDYPIPANDNAIKAIKLIVEYIANNLK
jgi:small subunit ribosomal protein S2